MTAAANVQQEIIADGGVAYGTVDGDLHVHGRPRELLLLGAWPGSPELAAVSPAGACLDDWLSGNERLAARWLHGPVGCGKTTEAGALAARAWARGWLTVRPVSIAEPAWPLQDRPEHGLLVVLDDADREPLARLTWLFSNALLYQDARPTRLLLTGRSLCGWPAVRATLTKRYFWTDVQVLPSSPDGTDGAYLSEANVNAAATPEPPGSGSTTCCRYSDRTTTSLTQPKQS